MIWSKNGILKTLFEHNVYLMFKNVLCNWNNFDINVVYIFFYCNPLVLNCNWNLKKLPIL